MKIAVIGSGISGLSAAHFLSKKYKVDLFEKNDHFGGHSYTIDVEEKKLNRTISMDLGFIVFNKINYPNLVKFFDLFTKSPLIPVPEYSILEFLTETAKDILLFS